jgi:uncharacterized membrane protein YgaE (UPF0421/DUF939 family)
MCGSPPPPNSEIFTRSKARACEVGVVRAPGLHGRLDPTTPLLRLRGRVWPILQTAIAALGAWYLAKLLLPDSQPVFASVAAVICIGATYGERRHRAIELTGGVVLGITVADLLVLAIGTGPLQLGLLVVLAMGTAVVLGGGPILVTEAAVSAILLVLIEPASSGLPPARLFEVLIGGGLALGISALAFPQDPVLLVGRSVQSIFGELGGALARVVEALERRDPARADAALAAARGLDEGVRAFDQALEIAHETARFSPGRRSARPELDRYSRSARHIDYAVRNTRVLARHVARFLRAGYEPPEELAGAIRDLTAATWALAAELDEPARGGGQVRTHASRAAARATRSFEGERELALAEIVAQVRSTAIDLMRAAEAAAPSDEPWSDPLSEELLVELFENPAAA